MRLIIALLMLMLIPSVLTAQSAIPKAVSETLNLSPRCKKGDLQRYEVKRDMDKLNEDGTLRSHKHDITAFTQYCSSNTPEAGPVYGITVDSFAVGIFLSAEEKLRAPERLAQFDGMTMTSRVNRTIPLKNGCYAPETSVLDTMRITEAFDFREQYVYLRLIEQMRFSAGNQLSKVGDKISISVPPICHKIPQVINDYKLDLATQVLEVAGIGKYGNRPCALITIKPTTSPVKVSIWAGDKYSYEGSGTIGLSGEFAVALDDGDIVSATIVERTEVSLVTPENETRNNRAVKTYSLRQIN